MPPRPTRAVYTALIGSYELLQEQPVARTSDVPFICLTDDPALTSETWEVRLVEPAFAMDSVRSSRVLKVLGGGLDDYDETLWVDSRIVLQADPHEILDAMLAEGDLGFLLHSFRDSVLTEFDVCARSGLDEPGRIYEQLMHYAETRPETLDEVPLWGAIIARRWTPDVHRAMRSWIDHILRYSRRDQLSSRYVLADFDRLTTFAIDNLDSPWHHWVDESLIGRNTKIRVSAYRTAIRAPLAELAEARTTIARLEGELAASRQARTELDEQVGRLRERVERLKAKVDRHRAREARLRARLAAAEETVEPRPRRASGLRRR
ncbi:hypothetical protein GCM10022237_50800 [Nocardioides ginsengisoli]|uniref:Glycosyltransferase domain-containing protein n=1 Tax=Nocardioides ginsengisoli TaxID=363868 RepID=A0ABW3VUY6_9ACTN